MRQFSPLLSVRLLLLIAFLTIFIIVSAQCSAHSGISNDDHQHSASAANADSHSSTSPISSLRGISATPRRYNGEWTLSDDFTVFVGVASFRDIECVITIEQLYTKAANPRRLFVGIIEQNEHGDPSCVPPEFYDCRSSEFCVADNIRKRRVAARNGRGPTFGRYISMLMYRGENFFVSIDSHNVASKNWDRLSIAQLWRARSPRPVLSHYPNIWDKEGVTQHESNGNVMVMCNGHYLKHLGYIRMDSAWMDRKIEPYFQPFSAAGYIFADAAMVHDVPFDPHLDYLFDGEEILQSVRMWTAGYDLFGNSQTLLWHDYSRHKLANCRSVYRNRRMTMPARACQPAAPGEKDVPSDRYWNIKGSQWGYLIVHSQHRVQYLLKARKLNSTEYLIPRDTKDPKILVEIDKFGIGKHRTVEQYEQYAMIDPIKYEANFAFCQLHVAKNKYEL